MNKLQFNWINWNQLFMLILTVIVAPDCQVFVVEWGCFVKRDREPCFWSRALHITVLIYKEQYFYVFVFKDTKLKSYKWTKKGMKDKVWLIITERDYWLIFSDYKGFCDTRCCRIKWHMFWWSGLASVSFCLTLCKGVVD